MQNIWNRLKGVKPRFADIRITPPTEDEKRLLLSFSAGRSGSRWMSFVFLQHDQVEGGVHRMVGFEEFFRYATWNKIPIDLEATYEAYMRLIEKDWESAPYSLYSSPYFAFDMSNMIKRFNPFMCFYHIREPSAVVNSNYVKGWYADDVVVKDKKKYIGPQPHLSDLLNHSLGRIIPTGDTYEVWSKLTQIGKITWYYITINNHLINEFQKLDESEKWYFKLEEVDQNYDYYRYLTEVFQLSPVMSRKDFLALKGTMVNIGKHKRYMKDWTLQERKDYEKLIGPFMQKYDDITTTGL